MKLTVFKHVVRGLTITAALSGLAMTAHAAQLKPDLHPAATQAQPRSGDFNGDGRPDTLYLADEDETGRVAVHVRLNTVDGEKDLRVTSYDASVASSADIRVVPAGQYSVDCGSASRCTGKISADSDSLILAMDGVSVLLHWHDGQFEQDFVRADDGPWTGLARTLTLLYTAGR